MTGQNRTVSGDYMLQGSPGAEAPHWAEMGSGGEYSTWGGGQGQSASQCPQGPDTLADLNCWL